MKIRTIGYWAVTGVSALAFAAGGAMDLAQSPDVIAGMSHLGYPAYFATILGTWKLLGAIALLVPRFPRVKEWAYAGMFFDLTGAALSHAAVGDAAPKIVTPLVLVGFLVASWALRPDGLKLAASNALVPSRPQAA